MKNRDITWNTNTDSESMLFKLLKTLLTFIFGHLVVKEFVLTIFGFNENWKKIQGKTHKRKVFISDNINRGAVVYFSGDLGIWAIWHMAEKNTQSLGPKIDFWLMNPGKP